MPEISVIIPVYNTEAYLIRCIDSVLSQTFQDFELICINDGSTDKSDYILKRYARKDKRIHLIEQKNQGQSVARNVGLDRAKGKYICFLDSDDSLPVWALETLHGIAESAKAPVAVSRCMKGTAPNHPFSYRIHRPALSAFVKDRRIFSAPHNKLYRADILTHHRFIPGIYFEDWPFLTILFGQIPFYADTEVSCYAYNNDNVSTTRSPFTKHKVDSYLTGICAVMDFYKDRPDFCLACRRIAVAVKMLISKVSKSSDLELKRYFFSRWQAMQPIGNVSLSLKTRYRLWKMKRQVTSLERA